MLSVLDQEYRVTVTALDDSDPPIGATTVPVTVKRPSQAPPPQPPHA
jgi:hypothetical protein